MPKILTENKFKNTYKSVMLFSAGMDSVMFNRLLNPDILLYIPMSGAYTKMETKTIQKLIKKGYISKNKVEILDKVLNLGRFERDDMIVPNRNAHLILLASMFGETIYLNSVSGDLSKDKCPEFFTKMEVLLDQMWEEQHWTEERIFKILDPYKNKTKTEILREYLDKGFDIQEVLDSYSCYEGGEQRCGCCKPCFRNYIALVNNDVEIPENYYRSNPLEATWLSPLLPRIMKGEYRGKEDQDIINALKKKGRL